MIGDANFSDHGANRLGASALMQGLADGYFVLPYTIGDYLAQNASTPVDSSHPAVQEVEREVSGLAPEARRKIRQARARTVIDALAAFIDDSLPKLSGKGELAGAMRYARGRWEALTRYLDDGRLEISNNAAERAIRPLALGRKNYMFAGSDAGGERAAAIYTLVETAKLNGLDPL